MHYSSILASAIFGSAVLAVPATKPLSRRDENSTALNEPLIEKLELASTAVDRLNMLDASDFVFDFMNPPENATIPGMGGHAVAANRATFPALIDTGVSMIVGFLGPCGFNTPHVHPRSSEINVLVQGRFATQAVPENGVDAIGINYLDPFMVTVFPQGSIHTEFNPDCGNATFVAAFASEDPGTLQIAQGLFALDPSIVKADLGVESINGEHIEQFKAMLPVNVALGVEQCLQKCNIPKQQPGSSGNCSAQ